MTNEETMLQHYIVAVKILRELLPTKDAADLLVCVLETTIKICEIGTVSRMVLLGETDAGQPLQHTIELPGGRIWVN